MPEDNDNGLPNPQPTPEEQKLEDSLLKPAFQKKESGERKQELLNETVNAKKAHADNIQKEALRDTADITLKESLIEGKTGGAPSPMDPINPKSEFGQATRPLTGKDIKLTNSQN